MRGGGVSRWAVRKGKTARTQGRKKRGYRRDRECALPILRYRRGGGGRPEEGDRKGIGVG